jgi:hypothetical protein
LARAASGLIFGSLPVSIVIFLPEFSQATEIFHPASPAH